MQKKENALCFSGHRSERLPESREQLEKLKERLWEKSVMMLSHYIRDIVKVVTTRQIDIWRTIAVKSFATMMIVKGIQYIQ